MTSYIDCRGLACPQPVIATKKAVESELPQHIEIIVDNEPALENVTRFLTSNGYTATSKGEGKNWRITASLTSPSFSGPPSMSATTSTSSTATLSTVSQEPKEFQESSKTLILMLSPTMGTGDDELGSRLIKNFLATLPEMEGSLWRIIMLNGAVSLAAQSSHVISELQALEASGVSILVCGTCLEHFNLLAQKAVGQTTNMLDVVTSLQLADKVIRI